MRRPYFHCYPILPNTFIQVLGLATRVWAPSKPRYTLKLSACLKCLFQLIRYVGIVHREDKMMCLTVFHLSEHARAVFGPPFPLPLSSFSGRASCSSASFDATIDHTAGLKLAELSSVRYLSRLVYSVLMRASTSSGYHFAASLLFLRLLGFWSACDMTKSKNSALPNGLVIHISNDNIDYVLLRPNFQSCLLKNTVTRPSDPRPCSDHQLGLDLSPPTEN